MSKSCCRILLSKMAMLAHAALPSGSDGVVFQSWFLGSKFPLIHHHEQTYRTINLCVCLCVWTWLNTAEQQKMRNIIDILTETLLRIKQPLCLIHSFRIKRWSKQKTKSKKWKRFTLWQQLRPHSWSVIQLGSCHRQSRNHQGCELNQSGRLWNSLTLGRVSSHVCMLNMKPASLA